MNLIISCILLAVIRVASCEILPLLANSSFVEVNPCENGDGAISCTEDCKGRKFCLMGEVYDIDCYTQTSKSYCDPKTLQCGIFAVSCDQDTREFACPGVGYYPHPFNCSKFYICPVDAQKAVTATCNSLIFDPKKRTCVSNIPCYTFSPVNGLCRGKNNSIVVHPLNKGLYVMCLENPIMGECALGLIFNSASLQCEYDCKSRGRFIDTVDERCYYECSYVGLHLKSKHNCCAKGEVFDEYMQTCLPNLSATNEAL